MILERIVLENFKSYSGKHVVGPFHKFTCIIGPNGCGKSNIMDAISFALGMSSQQLRSENVLSLTNRKSQGSTVSVSLVFKDDAEHALTREIRNMKSVYRINGGVTSYEDYRRFLEAKNIFLKIRNFLVFQSDVGSIAMKTPKELCGLFEEISGSADLREEYENALANKNKAIADCSYALEVKKDMMNKVKEMEKEKEIEKNFKRLMGRKEEVQRRIVLNELYLKSEQIREIAQFLRGLEGQLQTVEDEIAARQKEALDVKLAVAGAQKQFFKAENCLNARKDELKALQDVLLQEEEKKQRFEWVQKERERKRAALEIRAAEKRKDAKTRAGELEAVERGFEVLKSEHEVKRSLFTDEVMVQFEKEEALFNEFIAGDHKALNELKLQHYPLRRQRDASVAVMDDASSRLRAVEESLKSRKYAMETLSSLVGKLKADRNGFEKRIGKSKAQYEAILSEEKAKNSELSAVMGKMIEIKIENRESSRRMLIRNTVETLKSTFKGVYGRVVELIKPTQKKYEIALSSLLGSYDQAVVVENEAVAISAIEYIKESKLCRLTFLPLRSLRTKELEILRNIDGSRPAIDTIACEDRFKIVAEFLLKNALIVDNVHNAKELLYLKGLKLKICTLDGIIFHKNGFITGGGSKSKFGSLDFDNLVARRNKILREIRELEASKSQFSETEIVLERIAKLGDQICEEEGKLADESREMEVLEKEASGCRKTIEKCEAGIRECDESGFASRIREIEEIISRKEGKIFTVFQGVGVRSLVEFKRLSSENQFLKKKLEYEGVKARLESELHVFGEEVCELEKEIEDLSTVLERDDGSDSKCAEVRKEVSRLGLEVSEGERELSVLMEDLQMKTQRVTGFNSAIGTKLEMKNEVETKILQLTSAKARIDEEISETVRFAYLEEVGVPLKSGASSLETLESVEEIDFEGFQREDLQALKSELDATNKEIDENIPPLRRETAQGLNVVQVNVEYERCKNAVISTREAFSYVKKRRTDIFMECFNRISENICKIYKELTHEDGGEGNAFLILGDSVEPYNGGVHFHVMPPKKRFREINLLSGGEKTMASLALIFSLHSFRQAPFYVFDELDAALDKNNVTKLVSFLGSLDVQLIVITLKPRIFQCSDALVGVYRDCAMSSRILTYRLE